MKIVFLPNEYAEELTCDGLSGVPRPFLESLQTELTNDEFKVEFSDRNFGLGADWIWLLATIYLAKEVLKEGESINKGIEGWVEIGKRLFEFKKKHSRQVIFDLDALTCMAITRISEEFPNPKSIEKVVEHEKKSDRNTNHGTRIVDSYVLLEFLVNDRYLFIFGSNLDGDLQLLKQVDLLDHPLDHF